MLVLSLFQWYQNLYLIYCTIALFIKHFKPYVKYFMQILLFPKIYKIWRISNMTNLIWVRSQYLKAVNMIRYSCNSFILGGHHLYMYLCLSVCRSVQNQNFFCAFRSSPSQCVHFMSFVRSPQVPGYWDTGTPGHWDTVLPRHLDNWILGYRDNGTQVKRVRLGG